MPINYYCSIGMVGSNIEMNKNQLLEPVIENSASQPSSPVEGQMYYDTTAGDKKMYFYNGTAWVEMDGSGSGVISLTPTDGTFIDITQNATSGAITTTADLSATGTPSATKFLRGDNVWATPAGAYTSWTLDGDTGTPQAVADGNTASFLGGTGIDTVVSATDTLTITNTGVTSIVAGSNISISGSTGAVTISATGDITGVDAGDGIRIDDGGTATPEVNVEYSGTNNVIVKAPDAEGTAINTADLIIYGDSSGSDAVKRGLVSDLPFAPSGTVSGVTAVNFKTDGNALNVVSNTINSSGTMTGVWQGTSSEYVNGAGDRVSFPAIPQGDITAVVAGDYLTGGGTSGSVTLNADATTTATANKLIARDGSGYGYVITPSSGDSSTKIATTAFVQSSLTGLLEFKGGFNASTGAIVGGGNLTSGAGRVAVAVGDYYVVTVAGNFFGNAATPLTPGDSVIVQTAAAAGASVEGDFIVVQSDTDLATLTTVGLGNVNGTSNQIGVTYSAGTATLTNLDRGSSQNIFKNVASDSGTAVADNNNDTLSIVGGTNVTTSVAGDVLTITSTDTNTQRAVNTGLSLSGNTINANVDGTQTVGANTSSAATGRTYNVQVDASNDLVVNVPWTNTNSGGTVTSVSASHEGNAFTVSVGSSTTTPAIDIDVVGSSSQYINGEGNLVTFPAIPQGDVTAVQASTTNDEKGIIVTNSTGPIPTVGLDIKGTSSSTIVAADKLIYYNVDTDTNNTTTIDAVSNYARQASGHAATLSAFGSVTHNLNSYDVSVQLFDNTTKETVHACVDRTSVNAVLISGNSFPAGGIRVLVEKIG
jgi:hypothetical protein